jgi:hypothetical protein
VNGVSVEMFVYITNPAMTFYAFELNTLLFWKTMLLHVAFPVPTATKEQKIFFLYFLVFSSEMSPKKRCHKVTASSDEEDDA